LRPKADLHRPFDFEAANINLSFILLKIK